MNLAVSRGLIGSSWATIFATSGYAVCLYDISAEAVETAKKRILNNLKLLEVELCKTEYSRLNFFKNLKNFKKNIICYQENSLLRSPGTAAQHFQNISSSADLKECLQGAFYCQYWFNCCFLRESAGETLALKKDIFAKMDVVVEPNTIVGSSTSAIPSSSSRYLVVHPVNPPLFVNLVEIVPNQWTSAEVTAVTKNLMKTIGQEPVEVKMEPLGFALNRIQYAVIQEAWRLVKAGVVTPDDLDKVMKEGLGPRYAFFGIRDYMDRFMSGIKEVTDNFGPSPSFDDNSVQEVLTTSLNAQMPLKDLDGYIKKREKYLVELTKLKKGIESAK
ncbi:unnamed protein product [Enterobius vermicularis]|uniref:L-gulonate 3-dehydrogenase n=1 Tax=Enterobius vermicularis TaxID=51028 RepID=A0A0N4V7N2_ENTVE|nr:unnamed protein product [Enterobius vermicularis]